MDPLSGAASVIAVVDIIAKVITLCSKYYSDVKDAKADIERLQNEVASLQNVLDQTRALSDKTQAKKLLACDQALKQQEQQLVGHFKQLENELDPGNRKKTMHRLGLRALQWPLARQEVDTSLKILERFKSTITMALATDQLYVASFTRYDHSNIFRNLAFKTDDITTRIDDKTTQIKDRLDVRTSTYP